MEPANRRPARAGGDLERLVAELRAKGWGPERIDSLRTRWEEACHDPMNRGRGGPSLPENVLEHSHGPGMSRTPSPGTPERNPISPGDRSDLLEFFDRTAPWADPAAPD